MFRPLTGSAKSAMEILCNPEKSQPAILRSALALVRGAGVLRDGEIYARLGQASAYFSYDPAIDRLQVAKTSAATDESTALKSIAGAIMAKSKMLTFAPAKGLDQWYVPGRTDGTGPSKRNRVAKSLRAVNGTGQKLAGMIGSPVVRSVFLGSVTHVRNGAPHESFAAADERLQLHVPQAILLDKEPPFVQKTQELPEPEYQASLSEHSDSSMPLIKKTTTVGSYTRALLLGHLQTSRMVRAAQEVSLERVDYFSITDPSWTEELLGVNANALTGGEGTAIPADNVATMHEFLDAGDELVTPVISMLYAAQEWAVKT